MTTIEEELRRIEEERDNAKWVVLGDDDFELVTEEELWEPEIDPDTGKPLPPTSRPDNEGQMMPKGTGFRLATLATSERDFEKEGSYYRYTGDAQYVIIPDEINGETLTSYYRMFYENLTVVAVKSTSTAVTDMSYMFQNSKSDMLSLDELEVSGVETMEGMFWGSSGSHLLLSNVSGSRAWDTKNLTNIRSMFRNIKFGYVDIQHLSTAKATSFYHMFASAKIDRLMGMEYIDTFGIEYKHNARNDVFNSIFSKAVIGEGLKLNSFIGGKSNYVAMFSNFTISTKEGPLDISSLDITNANSWSVSRAVTKSAYGMFTSQTTHNAVIYVKNDLARRALTSNRKLSGLSESATVIVGGKGYIPPPKPIAEEYMGVEELEVMYSRQEEIDRTMQYGEEQIVRHGKKGKEKVTTRYITYVDGTKDRRIARETITPAVNEIVKVGTIVESERININEEYDFKTRRYKDYDENKGEKVVQRGEKGFLKYSYNKISHSDGYVEEDPIGERQQKDPVDEVIAVGMIERTNRVTQDEVIPYKTTSRKSYEHNYNDGKPHSEQSGKDGKTTKTYNVITYTDDTPQKWELINELTKTTPAVDEILIYGMIERSNRVNKDEIIPFKVKEEYSYDYKAKERNEPHVIERGKEGNIKRTYQVTTYADDTPQQWDLIPELTTRTEPEDEYLIYGLIESSKEEKEENTIKFQVEERMSIDLLEGEERVVQDGINGLDIRYYEVTRYIQHPQTGKLKEPLKVEKPDKREYTEAVPHIIEIGSKDPIKSIEDKVEERILKFEIDYVEDFSLYEGQEIIENEGIDGKVITKYQIITYFDDTTERFDNSIEEIPAVNQVVRIGTKDPVVREEEETEIETVPYEIAVIKTNDIAPGERKTLQEGKEGKAIKTYLIRTYWDGKIERELINEEVVNTQYEIILLGVSETITDQVRDIERDLTNYRTEYVETDKLYIGETRIKTAGKNGYLERIYIVTQFKNGKVERVLVATKHTPPVTEIILVGIKQPTSDRPLTNITPMNNKMKGNWLYLEDGDTSIRATVKTTFRPKWGYL